MLTGNVRLTWSAHSLSDNVIADNATAPWPAPKVKCRSGELSVLAALEHEEMRGGVNTHELIIKQTVSNNDPPVSLVWDLVRRSDARPPIPFTLKNIPLPSGSYETLIGPDPRKASRARGTGGRRKHP